MSKLRILRKKIDQIDRNILRLLNERAQVTLGIGNLKSKKTKPSFAPDREMQIYRQLIKDNKGPLKNQTIKAVYREIMSGALALQRPPKIAYLGPEATFTHIAALKKFGQSLKYTNCDSIADVFTEVERERATYGVVPIENSIEGAVNHTLDMFIDSDLVICSEVFLPIKHALMSKSRKLSSIKRVYSHQQVFAQCRRWLEKNIPRAELIPVGSTTTAAFLCGKRTTAAIASELAAEQNDLYVLARSIEDSSHNITRFLIIGKQAAGATGEDKTSIVFSMKDRSGALHDVLTPFKRNRINLTKIESRPSKKKAWKYYFFVDMEGHIQSKKISRALQQLKRSCTYFRLLGSYPVSV